MPLCGRSYRVRLGGIFCIYCGQRAECIDHFPPQSATRFGFLIPACIECNGIAGTEFPFDFNARAAHVQERLKFRYRRVLATPEWDRSEMVRLGYGLRATVKKWEKLRKITAERVAWNAISYLACGGIGKDFAQLVAETNTMPGREQVSLGKLFFRNAKVLGWNYEA